MVPDNQKNRTYNQYCALAKALDVVGKRWTLLLVRELLSGPKRFTDLQEGLPGIGTNLLSDRLTFLEDEGVIEQTELPPPASSTVYQLTDRGRELEDVVRSLQQWGLGRLGEPEDDEHFNPRWALEGLLAAFVPESANGIEKCYEFEIDDVIFHVKINDTSIHGNQGPANNPDVTVKSDSDSFLKVATGTLDAKKAHQDDLIEIKGSLEDFVEFLEFFPVGEDRKQ